VAAADLPSVLPNLGNFATPTLAFMGYCSQLTDSSKDAIR
jgi:hypothetical protein